MTKPNEINKNNIETTYTERLKDDYKRIKTAVISGKLPIERRIEVIREATERYVIARAEDYEIAKEKAIANGKSVGTVPIPYKDDRMLHAFADLVMYEDLTWSHPDKMSIVEYPIMSERQADTRLKKNIPVSDLHSNNDHATGFKSIWYMDENDGMQDSRQPIRNYPK